MFIDSLSFFSNVLYFSINLRASFQSWFFPLGSKDVAAAVDRIAAANPDAIVSTIHGGTNFYFFKELRARGVTPDRIPTLSVSMTEHELGGLAGMAGDYLVAGYFQAIDRAESRAFLAKLRDRYGADRVANDNMVSAYTAVHVWAAAAAGAGTPAAGAVAKAVRGVEFDGPAARVRIDPENLHTWRPWWVGRVRPDGAVEVVAASGGNVRPDPYPASRTRQEWEQLLTGLYVGWGNRWQAPDHP